MGLFDKAFKLPVVNNLTSTSGGAASQALSFAVAGATQKISEAASGMLGTMGGLGPFTKMGANTPSFEQMASSALLGGTGIAGTGSAVSSFLGSDQASSASSATATQIKQATGVQSVTVAHKVSLREIGTKSYVYFEVLPEIVEQHTTEYEAVAPAQFPGAFQKYKGNSTTQWTLNVTFISRTSAEATQNYDNLLRLRGWMKPFYGDRSGKSYPKKLGAPPPVLMLSGLRDLIGPVPVVITSLNWNWPKDVDYIATDVRSATDGNFIPFPAVLQVPIQLVESYSIEQFNDFSLADYRTGRLGPAFNYQGEDDAVQANYEEDNTRPGAFDESDW